MESCTEDLPLMANTNHVLVKHYGLDLDVCFDTQTIRGSIVLFLEPNTRNKDGSPVVEDCQSQLSEHSGNDQTHGINQTCAVPVRTCSSNSGNKDSADCDIGERDTSPKCDHHGNRKQASGITSSENCCDRGNHGSEDFVLVLDCCDLSVLKVEEVDVTAVLGTEKCMSSSQTIDNSKEHLSLSACILSEIEALPESQWKEQLFNYTKCSRAPGCGDLMFIMDKWSLRISKAGIKMPTNFPSAIRIWYQTTTNGSSVKWTKDQSGRHCVYTIGSPINNRALFPCQEPPVAMSTWHATIQAACEFVVLMSGENCATPYSSCEGFFSWFYYVTMPMPASTFTIAVGCWEEIKENSSCNIKTSDLSTPLYINNGSRLKEQKCKHMEYPCRFSLPEACAQAIIPHRVFASHVLFKQCSEVLLPLVSPCLEAAHAVLGTHPFPRLDILVVPSNFSSLGMASPHIIYLSQSVLYGSNHLCATRLCHEIAHAWFGLVIGARDWTEEWISEGFATHLEDVFLANVQKLPQEEARDQQKLKALLRWRRLTDELKDSQEELQILRPHGENTGKVNESGASVVRHGLNAEKTFMQVHYLKGYFLLRSLANTTGQDAYFAFLRQFVNTCHGQLILSKDFLHMLFESVPELNRQHLCVQAIYEIWLDTPGIPQILPEQLVLLLDLLLEERPLLPRTLRCLENTYRLRNQDAEVRHRWCELVVKHKYTVAYKDVEKFLHEDQAMGVYLYGELMVNEDARQQEIARRCFAAVRDEMDISCVKVVGEMLF
eukprot:XP_017944925.1 PREDICTED: aminopeptidase O isoform X3 [Xenopus tropicalis]